MTKRSGKDKVHDFDHSMMSSVPYAFMDKWTVFFCFDTNLFLGNFGLLTAAETTLEDSFNLI